MVLVTAQITMSQEGMKDGPPTADPCAGGSLPRDRPGEPSAGYISGPPRLWGIPPASGGRAPANGNAVLRLCPDAEPCPPSAGDWSSASGETDAGAPARIHPGVQPPASVGRACFS